MPGFTTHYLFGVNTYKTLKNDNLRKNISEYHASFSLGLQGPDLFFYYLPSHILHEKNIGSLAHMEKTGEFLRHLLESVNLFPDKKEAGIARAYVMGFIGHYLLDRQCHPYVYWRTHFEKRDVKYNSRHMALEVDIDTELLDFYKGKLPSGFRQRSTILLTRLEVRTIATILYYVYSMTYPDLKLTYTGMRIAIRSMQTGIRLLHDPHGQKKVLTRKIESLTAGHAVISPMIPSDHISFFTDPLNILHREWHNPWKPNLCSTASFLDLMEHAQKEYEDLLPMLYRLFFTKKHSDVERTRMKHILNKLGSHSYHSGLDGMHG